MDWPFLRNYGNALLAKPVYQQIVIPMAIVTVLVFIILASGKTLRRHLGTVGLSITQRVMGLFVASIGVQFISSGLLDWATTRLWPPLRS